jgi:hypothetical protein
VVIIGVGIYYLDPAPCSGKDDNAEYKRNDEGECEFVKCKLGYAVDGEGMCVLDQSGKDCQGTDPNATYATNVSNVCTFVSCDIGYMRGTDGICIEGDGLVPVNCVGGWGNWGPCSATCGDGTQMRYYNIDQPEINGGEECPEEDGEFEERTCNLGPCSTTTLFEDRDINNLPEDVKELIEFKLKLEEGERRCMGVVSEPTYTLCGGATSVNDPSSGSYYDAPTYYSNQVNSYEVKHYIADSIASHWLAKKAGYNCANLALYDTNMVRTGCMKTLDGSYAKIMKADASSFGDHVDDIQTRICPAVYYKVVPEDQCQ